MKIEVQINKIYFIAIMVTFLVIAGTFFVTSSNFNNPSFFGHSPEDIFSGDTFVRWGRTDCPPGIERVYSGFAAGNHYKHGGGSTTLCLTENPTWDEYDNGNQNGNLIYGTEYQLIGDGLKGELGDFDNMNAPCAVCYSNTPTIMYPGSQDCPDGWDVLYKGYLMASDYTHTTSDTVCVDRKPQSIDSSSTDENGNLWYSTEVQCGALDCSNTEYVQDREVTCSVCALNTI